MNLEPWLELFLTDPELWIFTSSTLALLAFLVARRLHSRRGLKSGDKITVPDGFEATLYGDVNLDGTVDVADVVALNTLLLGTGEFEVLQLVNADCARDYVVDSTDSTLLMNYVGMLIEGDNLGAEVWDD